MANIAPAASLETSARRRLGAQRINLPERRGETPKPTWQVSIRQVTAGSGAEKVIARCELPGTAGACTTPKDEAGGRPAFIRSALGDHGALGIRGCGVLGHEAEA